MNRKIVFLLTLILTTLSAVAKDYNIFVDNNGVMRRSDTKEEVSYFGVNYTLPFAHAYRAINYVGCNHKEAIKKDVYHFARLGFNAFRVHIWDVEISDAQGNLIENDHLDLLDFLIWECEKRGISIMLTAQTNFNNGYPERPTNTGAYSYLYEKWNMHSDPDAIKAQKRYARDLASHVNKYTGLSYAADSKIVIMEVNNEPVHANDSKIVTSYINDMVKAFRDGGWKKPIFYNVSHNMHVVDAYYNADIQGTTYQWYPIGLVAGHQRKGNFLPSVDEYRIPFSTNKRFNKMAKAVYEYDPADILYSYIHPAMVRTFRSTGFQWITQFAYDPIDIAKWNTEYQTHFLNLAYTPNKALSMKISAEVAQEVKRGEKFNKYPQDTVFGSTRVSYEQDLSEFNNGEKFFYSNTTTTAPIAIEKLKEIAGVGSSPIIEYNGTGAYFIDQLDNNTWRLEVMPDVVLLSDPFTKPSLKKEVGKIIYREQSITIELPSLGKAFQFKGINAGNTFKGSAEKGSFNVYPGVYILSSDANAFEKWKADMKLGVITLGEYVAPQKEEIVNVVSHIAKARIEKGNPLTITAKVFGTELPDSVVIYPDNVSFWSNANKTYKMTHISGYEYSATIPMEDIKDYFSYNIVSFTKGNAMTYPQNCEGTPLSWDFGNQKYYATQVICVDEPVVLITNNINNSSMEVGSIPEGALVGYRSAAMAPIKEDAITYSMKISKAPANLFLRKYVADIITPSIGSKKQICVKLRNAKGLKDLTIGLVDKMGVTWSSNLNIEDGIARVDVISLAKSKTALLPAPYPIFLQREFEAEVATRLKLSEIENIEISTSQIAEGEISFDLIGVWLE